MVAENQELKIAHLYPKEMNIYGDRGNIVALRFRAGLRGISTNVVSCGIGDKLPGDTDIIVTGGGQDSGQQVVQRDLQGKASDIKSLFEDGVVCLAVCGMYQLLGHEFITAENEVITGLSYFDMTTIAVGERLIGNVVIRTDYGKIVGFENHSGQTKLKTTQPSLGKVIKGNGNNADDKTEGAVLNNVFGTYLHGPVLPKNPIFADELLKRALMRKYGDASVFNNEVDNSLETLAAQIAMTRP